jgi:hypothetical protein
MLHGIPLYVGFLARATAEETIALDQPMVSALIWELLTDFVDTDFYFQFQLLSLKLQNANKQIKHSGRAKNSCDWLRKEQI